MKIITAGDHSPIFMIHWNSPGDATNTHNSTVVHVLYIVTHNVCYIFITVTYSFATLTSPIPSLTGTCLALTCSLEQF